MAIQRLSARPLSPQVAAPALNKACRLRGDENEDGHARSASGRPPDHSGDTRNGARARPERGRARQTPALQELIHRIVHRPTAEPATPHAEVRRSFAVHGDRGGTLSDTGSQHKTSTPGRTNEARIASCRRFGG